MITPPTTNQNFTMNGLSVNKSVTYNGDGESPHIKELYLLYVVDSKMLHQSLLFF